MDEKKLNYDVMNGYTELRILENIFNYFDSPFLVQLTPSFDKKYQTG